MADRRWGSSQWNGRSREGWRRRYDNGSRSPPRPPRSPRQNWDPPQRFRSRTPPPSFSEPPRGIQGWTSRVRSSPRPLTPPHLRRERFRSPPRRDEERRPSYRESSPSIRGGSRLQLSPAVHQFLRQKHNYPAFSVQFWERCEQTYHQSSTFLPLEILFEFDESGGCTNNPNTGLRGSVTSPAKKLICIVFLHVATTLGTIVGWLYSLRETQQLGSEHLKEVLSMAALPEICSSTKCSELGICDGWIAAHNAVVIGIEDLQQKMFGSGPIDEGQIELVLLHWYRFFFQELLIVVMSISNVQKLPDNVKETAQTAFESFAKRGYELMESFGTRRNGNRALQTEDLIFNFDCIDSCTPAELREDSLHVVFKWLGKDFTGRFAPIKMETVHHIAHRRKIASHPLIDEGNRKPLNPVLERGESSKRGLTTNDPSDHLAKRSRTGETSAWGTDIHGSNSNLSGPQKPAETSEGTMKPFKAELRWGHDILAMRSVMGVSPSARCDLKERYGLDDPDSDSEIEEIDVRHAKEEPKDVEELQDGCVLCTWLDADVEMLYSQICSWVVDPSSFPNEMRGTIASERTSIMRPRDNKWAIKYFNKNAQIAKGGDVSSCDKACEYFCANEIIITAEVHYAVKGEYLKMFPHSGKSPSRHLLSVKEAKKDFKRMAIKNVTESKLLVNIVAYCEDSPENRALLKAFKGTTVSLGFIRDNTSVQLRRPALQDSPLMLFVVRSVFVSTDDSESDTFRKLVMRATTNRGLWDAHQIDPNEWDGEFKGDMLYLKPLECVTSYLRMFKAVYNIGMAPSRLQNYLYGKRIPLKPDAGYGTGLHQNRGNDDLRLSELEADVDPGCLQYLKEHRARLNESQYRALLVCLREMGDIGPDSSSLSYIHGPPGTGKSWTLCWLVAALMHHSSQGHMNDIYRSEFRSVDCGDGIQKNTEFLQSRLGGVKIMIATSSNQAADVLTRKLLAGFPSEDKTIVPEIVRVGRRDFEYGDLKAFSLQSRLVEYQKKNMNSERLENMMDADIRPSAVAKRALVANTIIYVLTNISAGGPQLHNLGIDCPVILQDEGANCAEPENLAAIQKGARRVHLVISGDDHQLPAVFKLKHEWKSMRPVVKPRVDVYYHFRSLMERVKKGLRCPGSTLRVQYRSHPGISMIQHKPFYKYQNLEHPENPGPQHVAAFNQPRGGRLAFSPFTIVDTSAVGSRAESKQANGKFVNLLETDVVDSILKRLRELVPDSELVGNVAILAPYRSQVAYMEDMLYRPGRVLGNTELRKYLDVLVCTSDALQGGERDVVIFSCTRSNESGNIGFMNDPRRFNVATSRSKKLLVIVGDSMTLAAVARSYRGGESKPVFPAFAHMWNQCLDNNVPFSKVEVWKQSGEDYEQLRLRDIAKWKTSGKSICDYKHPS